MSTTLTNPLSINGTASGIGPAINPTNSLGRDWSGFWQLLSISSTDTQATRDICHRLNCLGSSYYFAKIALQRYRFTETLHKPFCELFEREYFKYLIEFPRAHFKSSIVSECIPIWWALPFSQHDEVLMRQILGAYTFNPLITPQTHAQLVDDWVKYMKIVHDPNTRTLIASSTITNAAKIGARISGHYANTPQFRQLFPSILPDTSCTWSAYSLTHKRNINLPGYNHGEGTYEFIGVGGALQSRHFTRVIEDDIAGREILDSEVSYDDVVEWHQLLVGAFDSNPLDPNHTADQAVVSNRWAYKDLNSYISEHEPWFKVVSHSALGGCCKLHPSGTPIFPEEFSLEKLEQLKQGLTRNGSTYFFSCQFLNRPTLPGQTKFLEKWLNRFRYDTITDTDKRIKIVHILDADQEKIAQTNLKLRAEYDYVMPGNLDAINIIVDLNHAEEEGSCNHAVVVHGWYAKYKRHYLLDCWADSTSFDDLCEVIYMYGDRWHKYEFWCEEIAAQRLLRYPIKMHYDTLKKEDGKLCKKLKWLKNSMTFRPLKVERSRDFKRKLIEAMEPIFNGRDGSMWIPLMSSGSDVDKFIKEFIQYPHGATVDMLNAVAYAPRLLGLGQSQTDIEDFLQKRAAFVQNRTRDNVSQLTGY